MIQCIVEANCVDVQKTQIDDVIVRAASVYLRALNLSNNKVYIHTHVFIFL